MFRLRRYFSVTSLAGVVFAIIALSLLYRHLAFHILIEHEARNNAALTQVFANTLWPDHAAFVTAGRRDVAPQAPAAPPELRLRADVLRQMQGLNVLKVKIFNLEGVTVFSTDANEIGQDQSGNAGFQRARAGEIASDITFRERFDSFDRVAVQRDLVSSYVPIRRSEGAPVEAVLEVYSDVSELVDGIESAQWRITGAVFGILSLLYLFLFLIVRRADRIIRDQHERERAVNREKLRHQAFHDSLTGLPNRAMVAEQLEREIAHARTTGNRFAVLFVDLDQFRYVNDSLGHSVGDLLLQEVGERLRKLARDARAVARHGGDEFVMLVPDIPDVDHAVRVADKVRQTIASPPYYIDGRTLRVTPSIGISLHPEDGTTAVELIKNADAAVYHAKEMGRNNYQLYTRDMNAKAIAMLSLEHNLREALERGSFVLHYQPQIDLASGRVVGAEALLRWRRPDASLALPEEFIPVAEETGLIVPIGDWVLRRACEQSRAWQRAGLPPMPVSVNVSGVQFRQLDFHDKVTNVLREVGLAASLLELEITENVIVHGADTTMAMLRKLKESDVRLAIDDFGTGYSSLSYLKQFPVDRLKLDQSFVRGLPSDPDDLAISTAVLGMAQTLKLRVMAEGVETREQLDFLRRHGCEEAQGNYFSRPLPPEEFAQLVAPPSAPRRRPPAA